MATGVFTPYSTVNAYTGVFPSWVPKLEQERIAAYQVYEEIYWNHPETFKLVVRGTESKPIYIPSGRIIVETMNRYFCKGLGFLVDPLMGSTAEQAAAQLAFTSLFRREKVRGTFNANKRYGLIRGDMIFHVTADPLKPQGSRLSLHAVDPASYFPIYSDSNLDRIEKVYLVDQFIDQQNITMIRRQTYERLDNGQIQSSVQTMKMDEFAKVGTLVEPKIASTTPPVLLPPEITAFPVYHIKNFDEPGNPYGSSEMRGLEVLMAAINQSVSDEDIALALEGLGLYTTSSGGPVDEDGNTTDWILGPGRVVENVSDFKRVQGVGSVQPYKDHIGTLWDFMKQASGTPDAAIGKIDVQVAESGVALALEFAPIMSRADEKEEHASDVLTQMFYDVKSWFKAYEAVDLTNVDVLPTFGDRLPANRKMEIDLAVAMCNSTPPIMSATTARERLAEKGIVFAADEFARIMQEQTAIAEAAVPPDPQSSRLALEAAATVSATASGA